jgi:hypothetical protein
MLQGRRPSPPDSFHQLLAADTSGAANFSERSRKRSDESSTSPARGWGAGVGVLPVRPPNYLIWCIENFLLEFSRQMSAIFTWHDQQTYGMSTSSTAQSGERGSGHNSRVEQVSLFG